MKFHWKSGAFCSQDASWEDFLGLVRQYGLPCRVEDDEKVNELIRLDRILDEFPHGEFSRDTFNQYLQKFTEIWKTLSEEDRRAFFLEQARVLNVPNPEEWAEINKDGPPRGDIELELNPTEECENKAICHSCGKVCDKVYSVRYEDGWHWHCLNCD